MSKADNQRRRRFLRKKLFGTVTIQDSKCTQHNKDPVMAEWIEYLYLNFILQKPGPVMSVQELKQMIIDAQTPYYESNVKGQKNVNLYYREN